jgi:hypothetical protein
VTSCKLPLKLHNGDARSSVRQNVELQVDQPLETLRVCTGRCSETDLDEDTYLAPLLIQKCGPKGILNHLSTDEIKPLCCLCQQTSAMAFLTLSRFPYVAFL